MSSWCRTPLDWASFRRIVVSVVFLFVLCAGLLAGWAQAPQGTGLLADTSTVSGATLYRNPQSGLVRSLIGNFSFYGVQATPDEIAWQFLADASGVLGLPPKLEDIIADGVFESEGYHHVRFHQAVGGIPVWHSWIEVHITKDQHVKIVDSTYLPGIRLPSYIPSIGADDAVLSASYYLWPPASDIAFGPDVISHERHLYVYASDTQAPTLAWVIDVQRSGDGVLYRAIVDAADGSVLAVYEPSLDVDGEGNVFIPDPITSTGGDSTRFPNNWGNDYADINNQRWPVKLWNFDTSTYTRGQYADAENDVYWNNGQRLNRPANADYTSPFDYTRYYFLFGEEMAYYHTDRAAGYLRSIWTAEVNHNRSSGYPQHMLVNWQPEDPSGYGRNARYHQAASYDSGGHGSQATYDYPITIGCPAYYGQNYPDLDEDADIIMHEYNHAMVDDLKSRQFDGFSQTGPNFFAAGLAEGMADFFACNTFLHVEPSLTNGTNDRVADWEFSSGYPGYLRRVTCSDTYSNAWNLAALGYFHEAGSFWADKLWQASKRMGRAGADRLALEWITLWTATGQDWPSVAQKLIEADKVLNPSANNPTQGSDKAFLMKLLKERDAGNSMVLTDQGTWYYTITIEHGNWAHLKVQMGVKSFGSLQTIVNTGDQSGAGTKTLVGVIPSALQSYLAPTPAHVFYLKVTEATDSTLTGTNLPVVHDQGVIREFVISRGWNGTGTDYYQAADLWKPIKAQGSVESRNGDGSTAANYAEITLYHSELSQVEMVLGLKDLTVDRAANPAWPAAQPGWQLRLTTNGMTGWASGDAPRDIKVNLDDFTGYLPPSLARRWYLGLRDNDRDPRPYASTEDPTGKYYRYVNSNGVAVDDHGGKLVSFSIVSGGATYVPQSSFTFPRDIRTDRPEYVYTKLTNSDQGSQIAATTCSAGANISGTPTVTVGVQGATVNASSPYRYIYSTPWGDSYLPPSLEMQPYPHLWSISAGSGTINAFSVFHYNDLTSRIYRSADPHCLTVAQIPYEDRQSFTDVLTSFWAWREIEGCLKAGIWGTAGSAFGPSADMTRGEMAVWIARAYAGSDANIPTSYSGGPHFSDVPISYPTYRWIEYCRSRGIVGGYPDGTYRPAASITRDQLAVFIARAIGGRNIMSAPSTPSFPDVPTDFWAYRDTEYLRGDLYSGNSSPLNMRGMYNASGGVVVGGYPDGKYHPEYTVTRDQIAVFVARGFAIPQ